MPNKEENSQPEIHPWTRDLAHQIANAQVKMPNGHLTIQQDLTQHATHLKIHRCTEADEPNQKKKYNLKRLFELTHRRATYILSDPETRQTTAKVTTRTDQTNDLFVNLSASITIFTLTLLLSTHLELTRPILVAAVPTALAAAACQTYQTFRDKHKSAHLLAAAEILEAVKNLKTKNVPPTLPTYTVFKDSRNYLIYLETRPYSNQKTGRP